VVVPLDPRLNPAAAVPHLRRDLGRRLATFGHGYGVQTKDHLGIGFHPSQRTQLVNGVMLNNMHKSASLPELPIIMPQKRDSRAGAHSKSGGGIRYSGKTLTLTHLLGSHKRFEVSIGDVVANRKPFLRLFRERVHAT
jgi:hypothetical protein